MQHKLNQVLSSPPASCRLFTKLVLEAPIITESALEVIRRYCEDEVSEVMKDAAFHTGSLHVPSTVARILCFSLACIWA